jgi:serine/threonine-protein kinase 24/25/MST4
MKAGVFREEYIAILARELLRGLEYLHGEGKLHRDIKGLSTVILKTDKRQPPTSFSPRMATSSWPISAYPVSSLPR